MVERDAVRDECVGKGRLRPAKRGDHGRKAKKGASGSDGDNERACSTRKQAEGVCKRAREEGNEYPRRIYK